jgi:hypothetical protein
MTNLRSLLWLAVGAAVIVVGWLLMPHVLPAEWQIRAESPRVVGDSIDPFVYAGGNLVRPVAGSAAVRLAGTDTDGTVRLSIESPEPAPPLSLRSGSIVGRSWDLVSSVDGSAEVWTETPFHGNSGIGDARLPETTALIAGRSGFDLVVDGNRHWSNRTGIWSIAHAVRRDDGSIRQQGLVFSPLLRDKTGFSDPERLELTLLLYEDGPGSNVLMHLVFSDVVIERSPRGQGQTELR